MENKAERKFMVEMALELTFQPLNRRRVKCVQTGAVMKATRVASYRRNYINQSLRSSGLWKGKPETPIPEVYQENGWTRCPSCKKMNRGSLGTRNCDFCGAKYKAVQKTPSADLKKVLYIKALAKSSCPYCAGKNFADGPGAVNCRYCGKIYQSVMRPNVANVRDTFFGKYVYCPQCYTENKVKAVNEDMRCVRCSSEFFVTY